MSYITFKRGNMKVVVIGGGASGLIAGGYSALNGNETVIIEKNEKLGKKIYITGKGRCNVTNAVGSEEFLTNVVSNPKFLMSAIHSFSPSDLMELIESYGVPLKTERGMRVFPVSDKASDIIKALANFAYSSGVKTRLESECSKLIIKDDRINGVELKTGEKIKADKVIVATGGYSYRATGSTGDGYGFAKSAGHSIVELKPSLVGINLKRKDISALSGLALKNVELKVYDTNGKPASSGFGEMLFTHTGISGPLVLTASARINRKNIDGASISIDLKPSLDAKTLDNRIINDFKKYNNKIVLNSFDDLLPKALIPYVIGNANIDAYKRVNSVTKEERSRLVGALKDFRFEIESLGDINTAIITSGGVSTKEIDPKTMESKIVKGLYFVGEVLDVDALTGGFNLQIAFSTGYLAGNAQ